MKREILSVLIVLILAVAGAFFIDFDDPVSYSPRLQEYPPWGGGRGLPERDGFGVNPGPVEVEPEEGDPSGGGDSEGIFGKCNLPRCIDACNNILEPAKPCVIEIYGTGDILCGTCGTECPYKTTKCGGNSQSIKCCGMGTKCENNNCVYDMPSPVP